MQMNKLVSIVLLAASGSVAMARRLGDPVSTAGVCSDHVTTFTLKSQLDDEPFPQTVGAEFEVDSGVVGQTWDVTLTDNDAPPFFHTLIETTGDGAFNVTHPDAGAFSIAHKITATAVNQADGTTCTGTVTDPPLSGGGGGGHGKG